ncbi:hypothetical protein IT570_08705 [Candidatus Sumerlaeota bacterium]|nr:hypothetical protein [Candidatus Sumerlaeota bacterium]
MWPKLRGFALFFAILWTGNAILSHWIAHEFLAQQPVTQSAKSLDDAQMARGQGLMIVNLPLFIGLGYFIRDSAPPNPIIYWALVIVGSLYIPLILSALLLFTIHAPRGPGQFPGVDIDDGSLEDEKDLDD